MFLLILFSSDVTNFENLKWVLSLGQIITIIRYQYVDPVLIVAILAN